MNFRKLGEYAVYLAHGYKPSEFNNIKYAAEAVELDHNKYSERLRAKSIYQYLYNEGLGKSAEAIFFNKMAAHPEWHDTFSNILDKVTDIIRNNEFQKQAGLNKHALPGPLLGKLTSAIGIGTGAIGNAAKLGGGLALAAGAGLGSLGWLLTNDIKRDAIENEAIKAQIAEFQKERRKLQEKEKSKSRKETKTSSDW